MSVITGLHHVTVIAGDAQQNLDFYGRVLGMRLVKQTVNQDVPDTYHLFYADDEGHAGTDLTFFPWPTMPPGRRGIGLTNEVALAVPVGSLSYWSERLVRLGASVGEAELRFGERALPLTDPHGVSLALVETDDAREFSAWRESAVPEQHQIRGLHAVRMAERELAPTTHFLVAGLGFEEIGEERGWHRFVVNGGGSGRIVDVQELPDARRGTWGVGSVHHVAFRVPDDEAERAATQRVRDAGRRPTSVIDRFWFKSVYFKEPGGALFEIATDGPGFTRDESPATLGTRLTLPPWLEPRRAEIERRLPPLAVPASATAPVPEPAASR